MSRAQLQALSRDELLEVAVDYEKRLADVWAAEERADLQAAFDLTPGQAWLLQELFRASGLLSSTAVRLRAPRTDHVVEMHPKTPYVFMHRIRESLGADAIETVRGHGWRLTPLGRLRVRKALGEEFRL